MKIPEVGEESARSDESEKSSFTRFWMIEHEGETVTNREIFQSSVKVNKLKRRINFLETKLDEKGHTGFEMIKCSTTIRLNEIQNRLGKCSGYEL